LGGIQASVKRKRKRKGCDLCYVSVKAGFGNERGRVLKIGRWQEEWTRTEKVFSRAQQNYSTMLSYKSIRSLYDILLFTWLTD